ncbi:TonB-dependent receptor [Sphingomonas sp.]|uniref:TonB-dependent siderophore receptor n=1 Tax=Sphingomonas sp. TaxID=28214 RepID=UPI0025EB2B02|nr:TonB-dependent receptor [Sphingomonas sp.]
MVPRTRIGFLCAGIALSALAWSQPAFAQDSSTAASRQASFSIAEQPLGQAAIQFSQQAGIQLVIDAGVADGVVARPVSGTMSIAEAVSRMLSGTGLTWRYLNDRTITIERVSADGGERVLGAVRVQGSQDGGSSLAGSTPVNGINGSRDVTATEGTGSYTSGALTVGSKAAASIKDTPFSVSVLSSQQLQDQNITGIKDAMERLPGVISQLNGDTAHPQFFSRGFEITTFQIDGGAGLQTSNNSASPYGMVQYYGGTFIPQMDMSLYDHIEIIRGAAGTFNGFGDPGGVVNLVRKKPLDHKQLLVDAQTGSYGLLRLSVDLAGPLGLDGGLRGRVIATHQDNGYFYDVVKHRTDLVSATVEVDLTPTTLLSIGASYDKQDGGIWSGGLVRYIDGTKLTVPRSTCLCLPWAHFNTKTAELFGQIDKRIGKDWTLKFKTTYQRQVQDQVSAFVGGPYNPDSLSADHTLLTLDGSQHNPIVRWVNEFTLDGRFKFLGQIQSLVIGGNIATNTRTGGREYAGASWLPDDPYANQIIVNPLTFNPYDPAYSYRGNGDLQYKYNGDMIRTVTIFARGDFSPFKKFHITYGMNFTSTKNNFKQNEYCTTLDIQGGLDCVRGDLLPIGLNRHFNNPGKSTISWPPSLSFRYDLRRDMAVYGTYADIYVDQSQSLDRNNNPLGPVTGGNFEGGWKWSPRGGKININISGYYIRQKNFAIADCHNSWEPDNGTPLCTYATQGGVETVGSLTSCCYKQDPSVERLSYGTDFEISGEVARRWQVAVSYSFNKNEYRDPNRQLDPVTGRPDPLQSFSPRHLFKIWSDYEFSDESALRGLRLNLGVQGQSITFVSTSYCSVLARTDSGVQYCARNVPVHFTDPGHVVFALGGSYKINRTLQLQFNVENLFDKNYYAQVGGTGGGNFYGAPRNFSLTLRGKF